MTVQELNTLFGKNVRYYRKKKGWTQERLANEVGTHFVEISKHERGERFVCVQKLVLLAYVLGVDVWELFYNGGKKE